MSSSANTVKSINRDSRYSVNKLKDKRKQYLTTPFSTPNNLSDSINNISEQVMQYSPYDLFALRTKITGYISDILNISSVGIRYDSINENNRNVVIVVPIIKGKDLNLNKISNENFNKIQNRINYEVSETPNYCLAFQTSNLSLYYKSEQIPITWIMHMIPLLNIPDEYYGSYEIEELTSTGYLYLNLRSESIYNDVYHELIKSMTDQLVKMYKDGYVFGADEISEAWNLERVDSTDEYTDFRLGVYKPRWTNTFLTKNPVQFLQKLVRNPETLELKISSGCNQVTRYFISREMSLLSKSVTFDSNTVFIGPVSDLKEAEEIASTINDLSQYTGKVLFVRSSSKEISYYYAKLMEEKLPYHSKYPPMVYTDNDLEISYVTVGLINNFQDPDILQKQLRS